MKALWNLLVRVIGIDMLKFGLVGLLSTIIDFAILNLITRAGVSIYWAIFYAYLVGAANGYVLNNNWTYRRLRQRTTVVGYVKYAAISFVGLGITEFIVYGLFRTFHTGVNLNKLVAVLAVFMWNFLANRFFTFKVAEPVPAKG